VTEPWVDRMPERTVAMIRAFSPALNRSLLVGGALAIAVGILGTPLLTTRLPSPLEVVIAAVLGGLIGLIAAYLAFPSKIRRAYETFSWLGRTEVDRFQRRTGGPVPAKPDDIDRWLATTRSTPATRLPRAEILAFIGRYEQARAEMAAAPTDSPEEAIELASLRQYIDWLEHGTIDTSELAAAAEGLPEGTEGRAIAAVTIALADARDRFVRRDPTWPEPLASARGPLGRAGSMVVLRDTWSKLGGLFFIAALIAAIVVLLLR
jgi:hypothetical protein